jgi:thioredoxin reductase
MGNPIERADKNFEYIIVGAGPAGVQAAHYLGKAGRDYMILEKGDKPGYFFETYPRHRTLISINKKYNYFPEDDYNMRHDWNSLLSDDTEMRFTKYSDKLFPPADTLVTYMKDFCDKFNIKITFNTAVEKIGRKQAADGTTDFVIQTSKGTFKSKVVIMATGAMKERLPNIPGIELASKYSEHSTDQSQYINKRVAIIGGGNSAFETADHLSGHAAIIHMIADHGFKFAWDTHFPGDLRAINNSIIDMFHLKSIMGLRKAMPTKIEEIFVDGKRQLKVHLDMHLAHWEKPCTAHIQDIYDDVIFCTGWNYIIPEMWDDSCKPDMSACGKYPCQKATWESTNIDNLFFAGTCTQARDRRAASSFIHGFRYSAKCLAKMLNHLRHGDPLPQENFNVIDFDQVAKHIAHRMSTSSALYQLNYGVLCDIMLINPEEKTANKDITQVTKVKGNIKYFYELPTEWALQTDQFKNAEHAWVLILKDNKGSFPTTMNALDFATAPRMTDFDLPCQAFVQPMIRRYNYGKMVSETALGGNIVVRMDVHQFPGDQHPQRGLNKLKKLLGEELNMKHDNLVDHLFLPNEMETKFTYWKQDEIAAFKREEAEMKTPKPCMLTMNAPKWQRNPQNFTIELAPEH